jgi:hypothetical protein
MVPQPTIPTPVFPAICFLSTQGVRRAAAILGESCRRFGLDPQLGTIYGFL